MSNTRIANPYEFQNAFRSGRIESAEVLRMDVQPFTAPDKVEVDHVRLVGTHATGLVARGLRANGLDGQDAVLRDARFDGGELRNSQFVRCELNGLSIAGGRVSGCHFSDAMMMRTVFSNARIAASDFTLIDMTGARFDGATLIDCRFSNQRLGGAALNRADFRGAVLCRVDLSGANLMGARFDRAILVGVDLRNATLTQADFTGAHCVDVLTERADMSAETRTILEGLDADPGRVHGMLKDRAAEDLAAMASELILRVTSSAHARSGGGLDPLSALLRCDFGVLIRDLQGRGGPAELSFFRVDANGGVSLRVPNTQNEIRISEGRTAGAGSSMPPPSPLPIPPPSSPASPTQSAPASPATGGAPRAAPAGAPVGGAKPTGYSSLEID